MTLRFPRDLALAVVLSAIFLPVVALPGLAADPADPVVAIVNGKEIRRSALIEAQRGIAQLRQVPLEQVYDQLLDHVITGEIVLDQAKKAKLEDDPQVKAAFKDAQTRILEQAWIAKRVESDISEAAIKARFEELKTTMQPKEEVKVRHILVETEDGAKAVLADLKSGVSFEDEAKAKSKDPSGQKSGGDLGYITKEETVPEFSEAAFKLKPGEITQTPVKTQFGWHIIKVEDRRMAPPPTYDEAKAAVRNELAQKDVQQVLDKLKAGAKIQRFKIDGSPADAAKPVAAPKN